MLRVLGKGFFWGAGFCIAFALVMILYQAYFIKDLQDYYEERGLSIEASKYQKIDSRVQYKVLDLYKSDNEARVIAQLVNISDSSIRSQRLKALLFDKQGKFISDCNSSYSQHTIKPSESVYYEIECVLYSEQIEHVTSAKVKLFH